MKRNLPTAMAKSMSHKEKALKLLKIVKGFDLCLHEVTKAMPSVLPVHPEIQAFTIVRKKILRHAEKLEWEDIHFQLTQQFVTMLVQSKINIDQIFPNRLLWLFNHHLSKTFIYDLNCRLYNKPHAAMSMELLAKILGCTRNQLNYRQSQIDKTFNARFLALQAKCEALNHIQIEPSMFWRAEHA